MATYTSLSLEDAQPLGVLYGIEATEVIPIQAGSVNSNYALCKADASRVFLRIYEEQDQIGAEREIHLLTWLSDHGVPTPRPLSRIDGAGGALCSVHQKSVALFPWQPGAMRCQASVTPSDMRSVGAALAHVHRVGAPERREGRFTIKQLFERCASIRKARDPALAGMAPQLEALLQTTERERSEKLTTGLCHGDLFRDNVLWQGDTLVALLDFESAAEGPFVYDMAVTWLSWCFAEDFQPHLSAALIEGYQAERAFTKEDIQGFFVEAKMAALRFTITRITDYAMRAHLGANEQKDWRRFWTRYTNLVALGPRAVLGLLGLS